MLKQYLLIKPITTEKSVILSSENKYVFKETNDANKIEVAKSIKEYFGVDPIKVNISKLPYKESGRGRKKRSEYKRAIVTLKKGDKLDPSKVK